MTLQLLVIFVVVVAVKFALYVAFQMYFTEVRIFIVPEDHPFLSRVSAIPLDFMRSGLGFGAWTSWWEWLLP